MPPISCDAQRSSPLRCAAPEYAGSSTAAKRSAARRRLIPSPLASMWAHAGALRLADGPDEVHIRTGPGATSGLTPALDCLSRNEDEMAYAGIGGAALTGFVPVHPLWSPWWRR